jgi:hypothetical protein
MNTLIRLTPLLAATALIAQDGVIFSEDFSSPTALASWYSIQGDTYTNMTWAHAPNANDGRIVASFDGGEARPDQQNFWTALAIVLDGSTFTAGTYYELSFDIIGDGTGAFQNEAFLPVYRVAQLSKADPSNIYSIRTNYNYSANGVDYPRNVFAIPADTGVNSAISFLTDNDDTPEGIAGRMRGNALEGVTATGTTAHSFNFTYNGANSPDIGLAFLSTGNNFAVDNVVIKEVEGDFWNGYAYGADFWTLEETPIGYVFVQNAPWVYLWSIQQWAFLPDSFSFQADGNWVYVSREN